MDSDHPLSPRSPRSPSASSSSTSAPPSPSAEGAPAGSPAPNDERAARPSARRARAKAALRLTLGLALGLGITEAAFRYRDRGAFPLVNVYEADPTFGVRLTPGASTRVGGTDASERVTSVRINARGYRGAEWPAPTRGEALILGDSQSFGLGVEEEEALAARLRAALSAGGAAVVLDASVPTYGPNEYLRALEELVAPTSGGARTPSTVVIAVNLMNDLFEIERPNADRYTAVDGWAARVGSAPPAGGGGALVRRLIQSSHAAFALWRWRRTSEARGSTLDAPQGFSDLVAMARRAEDATRREDEAARASRERDLRAAEEGAGEAKRAMAAVVRKYMSLMAYSGMGEREWEAYAQGEGEPEDKVFTLFYGGCDFNPGRPNTYQSRVPGSKIREDVEATLREFSRSTSLAPHVSREMKEALDSLDAAEARLREVRQAPPKAAAQRPPSPLSPILAKMKELTDAHGAKLVVLAVPIDAMASEEARARRGISREDAALVGTLVSDLMVAAKSLGATGVDPTTDLTRAGAAAYLPDGHLSPSGHDAVARAVAAALASPPT